MIAWAWTALLLGFGLGLFTASRLRAGRTEDLLRERDALKAGWRNVTGIDIVSEYLGIARLRIAAYQREPKQQEMGL